MLSSKVISKDYKWKLYNFMKRHYVPTIKDYEQLFEQQETKRLEILWMDFINNGYEVTPLVLKGIEPLLSDPTVKKLFEIDQKI